MNRDKIGTQTCYIHQHNKKICFQDGTTSYKHMCQKYASCASGKNHRHSWLIILQMLWEYCIALYLFLHIYIFAEILQEYLTQFPTHEGGWG